jgi:predicted AAA+ superfamily ATPase
VAQMLRAKGDNLFYFTMPSRNSNHLHEIDFLISRGSKICPIEVKSNGYSTHKSFDEFCRVYSSRISDRYIVYTKDIQHQQMVKFVPVYMTMFI